MDTFVAMIREYRVKIRPLSTKDATVSLRLSLQTVVSETMEQGATKFIATEKKAATVSRSCCDSIFYRFYDSTIVISREINEIR